MSLRRALSPALVISCLALGIALHGTATAVVGSPSKSTLSTYYVEGGIGVGQDIILKAKCQPGEYVIDGGWALTRGNFVWVLADAPQAEGRGWVVNVLVPNAIAQPGVIAARVKVKAVCAEKGKPVVP